MLKIHFHWCAETKLIISFNSQNRSQSHALFYCFLFCCFFPVTCSYVQLLKCCVQHSIGYFYANKASCASYLGKGLVQWLENQSTIKYLSLRFQIWTLVQLQRSSLPISLRVNGTWCDNVVEYDEKDNWPPIFTRPWIRALIVKQFALQQRYQVWDSTLILLLSSLHTVAMPFLQWLGNAKLKHCVIYLFYCNNLVFIFCVLCFVNCGKLKLEDSHRQITEAVKKLIRSEKYGHTRFWVNFQG